MILSQIEPNEQALNNNFHCAQQKKSITYTKVSTFLQNSTTAQQIMLFMRFRKTSIFSNLMFIMLLFFFFFFLLKI